MIKLRRELTLLDIFCMASGAMISSGLFILPAIIYKGCAGSVILVYITAAIMILPAVLSKAELSTAMPKSGGAYFYIERTLGSGLGLFSGLANWFSIALKSAFALVGMAVFIDIIMKSLINVHINEDLLMKIIATICCIFFMILNILSVKHTSRFQILLVAILLLILIAFVIEGVTQIEVRKFEPFFPESFTLWKFIATTGMVFVSYGGLTTVGSIGEEVRNPSRSLPLGMFLAWSLVSFLYFAVVSITVGVMDHARLSESMTPISDAARVLLGTPGYVVLAIAAMTAFITTANAGILSASRSLMSMSRDNLLPNFLAYINQRFHTPHISILITSFFMIAAIVMLNIEQLVKTASTLMIILYTLENICVIVMRESKIESYRPTFKTPLYPAPQIAAIIAYGILIVAMGWIPLIISASFMIISASWYFIYISKRVSRQSALMHVVERVTDMQIKTSTLENELRDILLERDMITADRFDQLISSCEILDIQQDLPHETVLKMIAEKLAGRLDISAPTFFERLVERESQGSTVITPGLAIPHVIVDGEKKFDIMMVRSKQGIKFVHAPDPVHCIFVLAGTRDERNYHLRALMAIAQVAQQDNFMQKWLGARDSEALRNIVLLSTRTRTL